MLPAVDISKYQGAWQDYPADIILIKMSGGDNGLYFDPDAATNYNAAKAAGKHVGGYHFVGWTEGAAQEASWFLKAMAPLAENDVYALDCENGAVDVSSSSPAYILSMVEYIHNAIEVWPLVYMNLSTYNSYDWSAALANCGLWLADWNNDPSATIPTKTPYVMQQYNDGSTGQAYDHDEWFDTLAEFDEYGYHAPVAPATPAPVVTPPTPEPVATPVTPTEPVVDPTPSVPTTPALSIPPLTSGMGVGIGNTSTTVTMSSPAVTSTLTSPVITKTPAIESTLLSLWQRILNWLRELNKL